MHFVFLVAGGKLYQVTRTILEKCEVIAQYSTFLVGIMIVANIIHMTYKVLVQQGNLAVFGSSLSQLVKVVGFFVAMLGYSSWIGSLNDGSSLVVSGFTNKTMTTKLFTTMLQNLNQKHIDGVSVAVKSAKSEFVIGGTSGTTIGGALLQNQTKANTLAAQGTAEAQVAMNAIQAASSLSINRPNLVTSPEAKIMGTIFSMLFSAVGHTASSFIAPIARDASYVLALIMIYVLIGLFPLAFVYSSIPGCNNTVPMVILMFFAVKMWYVITWVLDIIYDSFWTFTSTIGESAQGGLINFSALYPWCFIGLYIGVPSVLAIFFPTTAETLSTMLNAGVTMAANAAKTAAKAAAGAV